MTDSKNTTHFGFTSVDWDEKERKVGAVFQSVANRYDVMNDLMSMGIHRLWKRITIALSHVKEGDVVLDLAGGSGDLSKLLHQKTGASGQVILADINAAMIQVGRDKLLNAGILQGLEFVQANAQYLPFAANTFNCITMGFGLRNVTDKEEALSSMYRVCKPGGQLMILEFSQPVIPGLKPVYDWYSFHILPKLGQLFAQDASSYQYLAESIRMHPPQDDLKAMIETAGFEDCRYHNLSGGIVALHTAFKY